MNACMGDLYSSGVRYVDGDRFWEIAIDGSVVRTRFGAVGTPGDEATKTWPDPARARAEADRLIATKLARGFVPDGTAPPQRPPVARPIGPARDPALEAAITADRDDVDAHLVYADWLTEHGDPRLRRADRAPGQAKPVDALIAEHREHFLGSLHELSEQTLQITWRLGFIDTVRLERVANSEDDDDRTTGALLSALLAHPSGAFVRELAIGLSDGVDDGNVSYASVIDALAEHRPAHLRGVHLGDWREWEVSWTDAGDISPLWSLPRLDTLIVQAGAMELGTVDAPSLRRLELVTGGLSRDSVRAIARARCPALHYLDACGVPARSTTARTARSPTCGRSSTAIAMASRRCAGSA